MSLDETEKWASQIINELFDDDKNCNFNYDQRMISKNFKNVDHEICVSEANESSKYYEAMEADKSNFPVLTCGDLNSNNEIPESLSSGCCDTALSSVNNQNLLISFETSEIESVLKSSLNADICDQGLENLPFDSKSPMSSSYFEETKCLEELMSGVLSSVETSLKGKLDDVSYVPEIDSLKFYISEADSSRSLESKDNSTIERIEDADKEEISTLEEFLTLEDSLALRRIDENFKDLGLKESDEQSKMGKEEKCLNSQMLKDLYFDDSVETFKNEDMEYRWGRYDPAVKSKYYQNNQKPKEEVGDGLGSEVIQEKVKKKRQNAVREIKSSDNVIINEPSLPRKGKERLIKRVRFSDTCGEPYKASTTNICLGKKCLKGNLVRKADVTPKKYENDAAEYSKRRKSFIRTTNVEQEQNISDDNDNVIFQRAANIVSTYRYICTTIENFVVRPFAFVLAESIDLIYFVFIMSLCLGCLFYENVVEKLLNSSGKFELPFMEIFQTAKKIVSDCHDEESPIPMDSEGNSEAKELVANEESLLNVSLVEKDIDITPIYPDVISVVDPKSVLKIRLEFDQVKQNVESFYLKVEDYIVSLKKNNFAVAIVDYEHSLVDIIIQGEKKLSANEFDMEIIASSNELGYQLHDPRENSRFTTPKHACSVEKNPIESEEAEHQPTATSENSPFKTKTLVSAQEEYILNSTAVEDSKLIARAASMGSSNFNNMSSSNVDISFLKCPSKEKLVSSSSLSVNLPSFCSRSEMDLQNSVLFSASVKEDIRDRTMDSTVDTENGVQKKLIEENGDKASAIVNLDGTDFEDAIGETHVNDDKKFSFRFKNKKFHKSISPKGFGKITARKKMNTVSRIPQELKLSFPPNIAVVNQQNMYAIFDNLESEASESNERPLNDLISSEFDSLMEESVSACEKSPKNKNSGKLRRRMSSIFNNWKNIPMMQCVAVNPKPRESQSISVIKKYKKYFEKP